MFVARFYRQPRRKPPSGDNRNSFNHQPEHTTAVERLVEVARLIELAPDIATLEFQIELAQGLSCELLLHQCVKYHFRGKHPSLDGGVNAFQPLTVKHSG